MEAKDTVTSACRLCSSADNQAEISFKAGYESALVAAKLGNITVNDLIRSARQEGIKEVVEWVEAHIKDTRIELITKFMPISELDWLPFKKECGIEEI